MVDLLVLVEDLVDLDPLLEEADGDVDLLLRGGTVDLDPLDVCGEAREA